MERVGHRGPDSGPEDWASGFAQVGLQVGTTCQDALVTISEGEARRYVADIVGGTEPLGKIVEPSEAAVTYLPEVQNAIRATRESVESAIGTARLMNRFIKLSSGKSNQGKWTPEAVDSLRAALLFASSGLDTSLKHLVHSTLRDLCDSDRAAEKQFEAWAQGRIADGETGTVQAKELVKLLLSRGVSPRDALLGSYTESLVASSAQSAERVEEIARALGVESNEIRKRISPKANGAILREAFRERNTIAHELDVEKPKAEVRARLESIRKYRREPDISRWCTELLDVTQVITNDVGERLG